MIPQAQIPRRNFQQAAPGRLRETLLAASTALILSRYLVPTEGTAQGETLLIVQLWFGVLLLWIAEAYRSGNFRFHWDLYDISVGLLAGGHVLSAGVVLATTGDKRAALNLAWEWTGLALSFCLIRRTFQSELERRRLVTVLLSTAVTLSVFGIWQHHIWYAQTAAQYSAIRQELDELEQQGTPLDPRAHAIWSKRIGLLQQTLAQQGVQPSMQTGSGRMLFESRLKHSTEPFGRFALANTFAGFLLVWMLLVCVLGWNEFQRAGAQHHGKLALLTAALLIGYCLLLTKSRTAYLGLAAGLGVLGFIRLRRATLSGRTMVLGLTCGAALLLIVVGLLLVTGGLDRLVLAEAPKSFQYRLEYWQGSWDVIREHPWLGVGPGNFRQHYLSHKLPQSSEEIADPHNLILDVWANGGLIGLCGLAAIMLLACRSLAKGHVLKMAGLSPVGTGTVGFGTVGLGMVATGREVPVWREPVLWGCGLCFASLWLCGYGSDQGLAVLSFATLGIAAIAIHRGWGRSEVLPDGVWGAALIALLVHLLGAGGIGMPAITQTVLLLLAFGAPVPGSSMRLPHAASSTVVPDAVHGGGIAGRSGNWQLTAAGLVGALLFGICFYSATNPVLLRSGYQARGDELLSRNPAGSESQYRRAAEVDTLSPEPWHSLAMVAFYKWKMEFSKSERSFLRAVELQKQGIERDPQNSNGYRTLGEFYSQYFAQTQDPRDATLAADTLSEASAHYPWNSRLLLEVADACQAAGRTAEAQKQARSALQVDDINHHAGHTDKYLPHEARLRLEKVAGLTN